MRSAPTGTHPLLHVTAQAPRGRHPGMPPSPRAHPSRLSRLSPAGHASPAGGQGAMRLLRAGRHLRPAPPEGLHDPWLGSKAPRISPHRSHSMKETKPGNQASHYSSDASPCICAGYECRRRARFVAKRLCHSSGPGVRERRKPSVEGDAIHDCRPPAVRRGHCERARTNLINDLRVHEPLPRPMLGRERRRAEDHERPSHHSGMSDARTVKHPALRIPRMGDGGHLPLVWGIGPSILAGHRPGGAATSAGER
jgi:hypothetical protein